MVVSSLMSSKFWDIGENHRNWTHLRPNRRLSQKQNEFVDAFTMVHHTSNCYMQAVMNKLKFINLDYVATKKSGILDWRRYFSDWFISKPFIWKVMSSIPGHESTIHSGIITNSGIYTRTLNTDQQTETVVQLRVMFNTICYARMWRHNSLYTISRLLPAVAAVVSTVVIIILNVRWWSSERLYCV